jgi:hypothetical protein
MATNPPRSISSPLSKIKAVMRKSPSISPLSESNSNSTSKPGASRYLSPLNTLDKSDTSILEPSEDEFEFEFEVVDDEEGEWTDEQLLEYSRPGRRGKASKK